MSPEKNGSAAQGTVFRRDEHSPSEYPDLGLAEDRLCSDPRLSFVSARFEPGGSTGEDLRTHGTDIECVVVTKGQLTMMLADEEIELRSGDAVHFNGSVPHGCKNTSSQPAEVFWVTIPGSTS